METLHTSPGIIGCRKAEEAAYTALRTAALAARGIPVVMPVMAWGRRVGHVCGVPGSNTVLLRPSDRWSPHYDCTNSTVRSIGQAVQLGKGYASSWTRVQGSNPAASNWTDLWPITGGFPTGGTYTGAAYTARQFDDITTGAIWHGGDVSPAVKNMVHMTMQNVTGEPIPVLMVIDRVLAYEACSFNAAVNQAMTNGVAAQRYIGAGEPGLQVMVTAQTLLGATVSAFTQLQYTDNEGNTLQSMPTTNIVNIIPSAAAQSTTIGARVISPAASGGTASIGAFMPLSTGDYGVRLIDNFTTSAANTGTFSLVLCHPLALIPMPRAGAGYSMDSVFGVATLPIIKDGACLDLVAWSAVGNNSTLSGSFDFVWG